MTTPRTETVRLLNEQYEILWALVNGQDADLTTEERAELTKKLDGLRDSLEKITSVTS